LSNLEGDCFQLNWARADVFGLLSINVGPLSLNVVPREVLFSMIVVRKQSLFSVRGLDVFSPLQLFTLLNLGRVKVALHFYGYGTVHWLSE
jgi:hypothetical protein